VKSFAAQIAPAYTQAKEPLPAALAAVARAHNHDATTTTTTTTTTRPQPRSARSPATTSAKAVPNAATSSSVVDQPTETRSE
jgi:hypothetical protein